MAKSDYCFNCKTREGFIIKALFEVLQNMLIDVCFKFSPDGIYLLTVDNKKRILVNLKLDSESFDEYKCEKDINVGINLQHTFKMLKSVKKKDSLEMKIDKKTNDLIITTISADTQQPVNSHIKTQRLGTFAIPVPTGYGHPVHVATTTFQKTCKDMQNINDEIVVKSRDTFMSFSCGQIGICYRDVPFGADDPESESEMYEDTFFTKSLSQLTKISGLNKQMQIYPLKDKPLKIGIGTGQLGRLEIYIKSVEQIRDGEE